MGATAADAKYIDLHGLGDIIRSTLEHITAKAYHV